ncbi:TPA: hypothetical protein JD175_08220 [Cronobacter sakazakii]|nr:hypothetical protein [Cronobacter sakazakii]
MTGLPATDRRSARLPDVPSLAVAALYAELNLTPKPGLVDCANSGAHRDMDHALFVASIRAIAPWLRVFYQQGVQDAGLAESEMLRRLRPAGLACEQAMFSATGGVNTHKGGIFSLGLLCAAAGRLAAQGESLTPTALCMTVSAMTRGIVARELAHGRRAAGGDGGRAFVSPVWPDRRAWRGGERLCDGAPPCFAVLAVCAGRERVAAGAVAADGG